MGTLAEKDFSLEKTGMDNKKIMEKLESVLDQNKVHIYFDLAWIISAFHQHGGLFLFNMNPFWYIFTFKPLKL